MWNTTKPRMRSPLQIIVRDAERRHHRAEVLVPDGARLLPLEPELDARDGVHEHRDEEHRPHEPQERHGDAEQLGVVVDGLGPLEHLEVSDHVAER